MLQANKIIHYNFIFSYKCDLLDSRYSTYQNKNIIIFLNLNVILKYYDDL